jgi:hypothetical protein
MRETLVRAFVGVVVLSALGGCAVDADSGAENEDVLMDDSVDIGAKESQIVADGTVTFDYSVLTSWILPTPRRADVADGTQVDTMYPGVTFSSLICGSTCVTGHAYSREYYGRGKAVSMFGTGLPYFNSGNGAIEATFSNPVAWASMDVTPIDPALNESMAAADAKPWVEAYDPNGNLIQKVWYPYSDGQAGFGTTQVLFLQGNIKRLRFSSKRSGLYPIYGMFDNLTFPGAINLTPVVKPPVIRPVFPTTLSTLAP